MFYYLYQITNNLNGKIYVGVHKTNDISDGYMGSGKIIRSAIQKHGISNFSKVILETFENAEAMYAREKEVVNDEFLLREDTYNLRRGGHGGWDFVHSLPDNRARWDSFDEDKQNAIRGKISSAKTGKTTITDPGRDALSEYARCNNPMFSESAVEKVKEALTGVAKTEDHKNKISEALKGKNSSRRGRKLKPGRTYSKPRDGKLVTCPHCGKIGSNYIMPRWHLDNCKQKPL